jgi:RNA polymerase subunit RPABC4/transcription elongation factor Spt4
MSDDAKGLPEAHEKKCPQCGSETFAWISGDGGVDMFECRQCKAVFTYRGDW